MPKWLEDPVDVAEYVRLFKKDARFDNTWILTQFTQTATRYVATWHHADFENKLEGKVSKLNAWIRNRQLEELEVG